MFLFKRKKKDDEAVDMNDRSPETGLKYKDIALLGQMMKQGADLNQPRHALYYLYFGSREAAEAGAITSSGSSDVVAPYRAARLGVTTGRLPPR